VGLVFMMLVVPVTRMYQKTGAQRKLAEAYAWLLMSVGAGGIAALAQEMYEVAAMAFVACGVGALGCEGITNALWRMLIAIRGLTDEDREA
jgi:hypothetical protein